MKKNVCFLTPSHLIIKCMLKVEKGMSTTDLTYLNKHVK